MALAIRAAIPALAITLSDFGPRPDSLGDIVSWNRVRPTPTILDIVEFCHEHVAAPAKGSFHPFFNHYHLQLDRQAGQAEFRDSINSIFVQNGLAYELQADGQVIRLAPPVLREALATATFATGDPTLDQLLESARMKFLNPGPAVRHEGLKDLYDAFERLKTLELPTGHGEKEKKKGVEAMLNIAAGRSQGAFRDVLDREARELTNIGNQFQIRHSERNQVPLELNQHVDYIFHRLFAFVCLVLSMREKAEENW